jgi:hypothetical protein
MKKYKFMNDGSVFNTEEGFIIYPDPNGRYWMEYMRWVYAGNEADPADPVVPPQRRLPKEEIIGRMTDDECETLRELKKILPARLVLLWDEAWSNEINPDDPRLRQLFSDTLGIERANEILG